MPNLQALLPNVQGKSLLDLGCGFEWVCRWASDQGAASVTGTDVSENMLRKTREHPEDLSLTYLEGLGEGRPPSSYKRYDVVYSSLTFHYLQNLEAPSTRVFRNMRPGGSFVFSVEHPTFTAPRNARWIKDGCYSWPHDGYLHERPLTTRWFTDGMVKQHRSIGTYFTLLLKAGFLLTALDGGQVTST